MHLVRISKALKIKFKKTRALPYRPIFFKDTTRNQFHFKRVNCCSCHICVPYVFTTVHHLHCHQCFVPSEPNQYDLYYHDQYISLLFTDDNSGLMQFLGIWSWFTLVLRHLSGQLGELVAPVNQNQYLRVAQQPLHITKSVNSLVRQLARSM